MDLDLNKSRRTIDKIDEEIVRLFQERMREAALVAEYKKTVGKKVFDPVREEEKLQAVSSMVEGEFSRSAIRGLYGQIMSISRKLQYKRLGNDGYDFGFRLTNSLPTGEGTRVAFFGEEGSYSQQAMLEEFGEGVSSVHFSTFKDVMEAVHQGGADYGVLPLENSSTGGITDIYDLFMQFDNHIVGERVLAIDHALLGLPGASLEDVRTVYSHSQGLRQCAAFLEAHPNIRQVEYASTADGAKKVLGDGDKTQAAIAGIRAARQYHLVPLAQSINAEEKNQTRFVVLSGQSWYTKEADKLSLCFELPHQSGSLYHMLSHFTYNGLNLTKIESRPIPGKNWEYRFFVDIEGNWNDPGVQNACIGVKEESAHFRILGNYQGA